MNWNHKIIKSEKILFILTPTDSCYHPKKAKMMNKKNVWKL